MMYKVSDEQYVEIAAGLKATDEIRLTHSALQTTDIEAARRLLHSRGIAAARASKDAAGDLSFTELAPEGTRSISSSTVQARSNGMREAAKRLCVANPASAVPTARETFAQLDARISAAYPGHASLAP